MINSKRKIIKSIKSITVNRILPVNLIDVHKLFFNRLLTSHVGSINVLRLKGFSITAQGVVFKRATILKELSLSNDLGLIVKYTIRDLLKILFFWPCEVKRSNVKYLIADNVYSHTYYHWLTEALPRLFLIKNEIPGSVLLLPSTHNQKFHDETLHVFDVCNVELLKPHVRYIVPDLITATPIGTIANYHPEVIRDMVDYIKSKIDLSINLGERIYVSRSRAQKRKVLNEDELEIYLKRVGFKVVHFEDYSFAEQVSIMNYCSVFVGIHGAGLANMIFMKKEGKVLELRKEDGGENYFYFTLASTAGQLYYYQFCETSDSNKSVQDSDIIVDLKILSENIQNMLLG